MTTKTIKCYIEVGEREFIENKGEDYIRAKLTRMLASEIAGVLIRSSRDNFSNSIRFDATVDIDFKDAK